MLGFYPVLTPPLGRVGPLDGRDVTHGILLRGNGRGFDCLVKHRSLFLSKLLLSGLLEIAFSTSWQISLFRC